MKLFATDLDGTLVDRQGGMHPRDLAAIAAARAQGVIVTIATGRLTSTTHPVARALRLDTPLVCADGGVLACSSTERVLSRKSVRSDMVEDVLSSLRVASLASFVMTEAEIHGCPLGVSYHGYLRGWSSEITTHADLRLGHWRDDPGSTIMLVGIGEHAAVEVAVEALNRHEQALDVVTFEGAFGRVVRVMAKGASKGATLAALAEELGVERENVAVAGDFWNDLSMFEYAGRSFAMPHAPPEVRAAATHALDHDVVVHGSFADALEDWLREPGH